MSASRDLTDLSDPRLVEMARAARPGDTAAFNELVRRHQGHIRANCRYMTGNVEDAEDLAQDAFVKAFFALPGFRGHAGFKTWLRRIKVNRCLDHLDSVGRRSFVDVEDASRTTGTEMVVPPAAEAWLEGRDRKAAVGAVLDTLNDTLRLPLVMHDMDGMTYDEIAEALDIGLSAAKMRVNRARQAFRATWQGRVTEEEVG